MEVIDFQRSQETFHVVESKTTSKQTWNSEILKNSPVTSYTEIPYRNSIEETTSILYSTLNDSNRDEDLQGPYSIVHLGPSPK